MFQKTTKKVQVLKYLGWKRKNELMDLSSSYCRFCICSYVAFWAIMHWHHAGTSPALPEPYGSWKRVSTVHLSYTKTISTSNKSCSCYDKADRARHSFLCAFSIPYSICNSYLKCISFVVRFSMFFSEPLPTSTKPTSDILSTG